MPGYFTLYWSQETCDQAKENERERCLPIYNYSNYFYKRGVRIGDIVYSFNVKQNKLYLICSLEGNKIVDQETAAENLCIKPKLLPNFDNYLMAKSATKIRFDRTVSPKEIKHIFFMKKKKILPQKCIDVHGRNFLYNTFKGVREITKDSADLLDGLLKEKRVKITNKDIACCVRMLENLERPKAKR